MKKYGLNAKKDFCFVQGLAREKLHCSIWRKIFTGFVNN